MENKICCFFGHRDAPEELLPSLVSLLEELTEQQGITVFWVGGHGQFDRLAAEAVCRLRERFPRIRLELVAAYPYAAEKPPRMADRAFLPEGLAQAPPKAAIVRRNRWMAQHADVVVTYLRRDTGVAYRAVCEARRWGKRIVPL